MTFKSARQRKAVMAKIRGLETLRVNEQSINFIGKETLKKHNLTKKGQIFFVDFKHQQIINPAQLRFKPLKRAGLIKRFPKLKKFV